MIPHKEFASEACENGWQHAIRIVRTISRNGTDHVSLRCYYCNASSDWIKHDTLRKEYGIEPEEAEIWQRQPVRLRWWWMQRLSTRTVRYVWQLPQS